MSCQAIEELWVLFMLLLLQVTGALHDVASVCSMAQHALQSGGHL